MPTGVRHGRACLGATNLVAASFDSFAPLDAGKRARKSGAGVPSVWWKTLSCVCFFRRIRHQVVDLLHGSGVDRDFLDRRAATLYMAQYALSRVEIWEILGLPDLQLSLRR